MGQEILNELRNIKIEIEYIKSHMVDVDMFLTPEEEQRLEKSLIEHKKGKTKRVV